MRRPALVLAAGTLALAACSAGDKNPAALDTADINATAAAAVADVDAAAAAAGNRMNDAAGAAENAADSAR